MEPQYAGFFGPFDGFLLNGAYEKVNFTHGLNYNNPSVDIGYLMENPFVTPNPQPCNSGVSLCMGTGDGERSSDENDHSDAMFKFINQMLMEEDFNEMPSMFHDPLALQAAEKSFQDVLCDNYTTSSDTSPLHVHSPDDCYSGCGSDYGSSSSCITTGGGIGNSVDSQWIGDLGDGRPSILQTPVPENYVFQATESCHTQQPSLRSIGVRSNNKGVLNTFANGNLLAAALFTKNESAVYFQKGLEEASKFLPSGNLLKVAPDKSMSHPLSNRKILANVVEMEGEETGDSCIFGPRGKKNHKRDEMQYEEERSCKQSAVDFDEAELSEMFDRVLLCAPTGKKLDPEVDNMLQNGVIQNSQQNVLPIDCRDNKIQSNILGSKKKLVDLRTLLTLCAEAVSKDDCETANMYLKQIRKHSSALGDGSQRLAHCLANALEARLAGTGSQIYAALVSKRVSATDMLKAYRVYVTNCPFQRFAIIFSNHMILSVSENASVLHIIDFGILYGFQWPALIHCLSRRAKPPKLRVTGIEIPQSGFRPEEKVQETGHRLAKYCERFHVPFEYNCIAKKWESIRIEDLKLRDDEVVAVNCIYRFKNLLDETVVMPSPRDYVLNLIRRIKPQIFVHSIVNGSYNASFFRTRFRETLFHYSALFDAFDTKLAREDPMRLVYEKEFYGREAINAIACEGTGRVERPETYKQWHIRNTRAGFKQLPLDPVIVKKLADKLKEYHVDFVVDRDGHWMLQGWKGRILYASSSWIPV